jgi:hypothetical protein
LKKGNFKRRKVFPQRIKILLKRGVSIYRRLSLSQQIKIWSVDYLNLLHFIVSLLPLPHTTGLEKYPAKIMILFDKIDINYDKAIG